MPDNMDFFESVADRDEYHEWLDTTEDEYLHRPFDVRCLKCDTVAYGSQANLEALGWKLGKHEFCPNCA